MKRCGLPALSTSNGVPQALEPFERGMRELAPAVWITALRKEQNPQRAASLQPVMWDWQPIPFNGYPRPKGATPMRVSLVPAYTACSSANDTHGAPLASAFRAAAPSAQNDRVEEELAAALARRLGPALDEGRNRLCPCCGLVVHTQNRARRNRRVVVDRDRVADSYGVPVRIR